MPAFVFSPAAEQASDPAETQVSLFSIQPTRPLTDWQVSFMVARLRDDAQTCWEALVQASNLARQRARLLDKLGADELKGHPSRPSALHRAVGQELDLRHWLTAAATVEFWADATWRALSPAQRSDGAEAWGVPADRERLIGAVWTAWPAFSWPSGFDWADEIGHSGHQEVKAWLVATGKSPPDPPRLGPALQLAVDEGMNV